MSTRSPLPAAASFDFDGGRLEVVLSAGRAGRAFGVGAVEVEDARAATGELADAAAVLGAGRATLRYSVHARCQLHVEPVLADDQPVGRSPASTPAGHHLRPSDLRGAPSYGPARGELRQTASAIRARAGS